LCNRFHAIFLDQLHHLFYITFFTCFSIREGDYTPKIEEWMELQKRMIIYELGSLSPFLLVFAGEIVPGDHRLITMQ
jgi:hypothetical protein